MPWVSDKVPGLLKGSCRENATSVADRFAGFLKTFVKHDEDSSDGKKPGIPETRSSLKLSSGLQNISERKSSEMEMQVMFLKTTKKLWVLNKFLQCKCAEMCPSSWVPEMAVKPQFSMMRMGFMKKFLGSGKIQGCKKVPKSWGSWVPDIIMQSSGKKSLRIEIFLISWEMIETMPTMGSPENEHELNIKLPAVTAHLKFLTMFLDFWKGSYCGTEFMIVSSSEEKQSFTVILSNLTLGHSVCRPSLKS